MELEFRPAEPDTGLVFVRRDLPGQPRIKAAVANRVETPRRTTLSAGGSNVEMVEHVLAALSGLQIDNCEIWVDEAEMPGCDGSSLPFVAALDVAGVCDQDAAAATARRAQRDSAGRRRHLGRGTAQHGLGHEPEISPRLR